MIAVDVATVPVLVAKVALMQIQGLVTGAIYAASFKAQMIANCFGEVADSRISWNAHVRGQARISPNPEPYYTGEERNDLLGDINK